MKNRKCPFCNQTVKFVYPYLMYLNENKKWTFHHGCDFDLSVIISADTKEAVIAKWNGSAENE